MLSPTSDVTGNVEVGHKIHARSRFAYRVLTYLLIESVCWGMQLVVKEAATRSSTTILELGDA